MKLLSSDFFPAKQAYRWRTTSLNDTADAEDFPEQVWMRTAGNDSSLLCTQVSKESSCSCQQLFMMDQRNEQNLSLVFLIDFRQLAGSILSTVSTKCQRNGAVSHSQLMHRDMQNALTSGAVSSRNLADKIKLSKEVSWAGTWEVVLGRLMG